MLRDSHLSAPLYRQTEGGKKKKTISLEFTADPFGADAIMPAAGLLKSQLGPEAPYVIKRAGNFWMAPEVSIN